VLYVDTHPSSLELVCARLRISISDKKHRTSLQNRDRRVGE